MANQEHIQGKLQFGPFELDSHSGGLRKSGIPIRISGQPVRILRTLVAHPGELVSREQLRAEIWSETTFVDFDHGLNAAINKLRRALGDSPDAPLFIETVPGRGYRFIGVLTRVPPVAESQPYIPGTKPPPPAATPKRWWVPATVLAMVIIPALFWSQLHVPTATPEANWKMTRLTADAGLSRNPTLSPDGKLVAYSSDREMAGGPDLYIQQVLGVQRIRLTFDGEGNSEPAFSPDGSKLVFRSNRHGGGIYEIPAFGGEPRLVAKEGLDPKYSPDGLEIAYWIGSENVAQAVPGNGTVWVVPAAGGQVRQVGSNFTSARHPVWAPDGKSLLVIGYTSKAAYDNSALDWWLVPVRGAGSAMPTGFQNALTHAGVRTRDAVGNFTTSIPIAHLPEPRGWLMPGNRIIFSAEHGDTSNLWAASISRAGTMSASFQRLTAGAGREVEPAAASDGSIAFANLEGMAQVWSLPLEQMRRNATPEMTRVTSGLYREEYPSLSADGSRIAFVSDQSGLRSVWVRDLKTGQQTRVAPSPFAQRYPALSPSGRNIAFSSYERDKRLVYVVAASGGTPELMCEDCLRATDWSHDEKAILVQGGSPYRISILDVASRKETLLIEHPTHHVLYGRFSPDNRWISFTARMPGNRSWISIAELAGSTPIRETAWVKVSEEGPEDRGEWSRDGKMLYFTSERDGHLCLWGQRINAVSHRPVGDASAVCHFHARLKFQELGWSLGGGQAAMTLLESRGNIWMMSRPPRANN